MGWSRLLLFSAWSSALLMNYVGLAHLPPFSLLFFPFGSSVLTTYSQIIVLTTLAIVQHSYVTIGLRKSFFFVVFVLGFVALSETYGSVVFGANYAFTTEFGPGVLVPFAWLCAAYPSFGVAQTLLRNDEKETTKDEQSSERTRMSKGKSNRRKNESSVLRLLSLALFAALLTSMVDVTCDSVAASGGTHQWLHFNESKPLWIWELPPKSFITNMVFEGVPISNYIGWFLTSFVFFSAFLMVCNVDNVQFGVLPLWINFTVGFFYAWHPVHSMAVKSAAVIGMITPSVFALIKVIKK